MTIRKRGDVYLRTLLIHDARFVIRSVARKDGPRSRWVNTLIQRRGQKVVAVAIANKNTRISWTLMAKQDAYWQVAGGQP